MRPAERMGRLSMVTRLDRSKLCASTWREPLRTQILQPPTKSTKMTTLYSATLSHPACIGSSGWQLQAAHPPTRWPSPIAVLQPQSTSSTTASRRHGQPRLAFLDSLLQDRTAQSPLAPGRVRRLRFRRLHMRAPQPLLVCLSTPPW